MKLFLQIFGVVFMAEVFAGMLALLLETRADVYPVAAMISSSIFFFLSLPFNLVEPEYPYNTPETESGFIVALLIMTTLLIHTLAVYVVYKAVHKPAFK